MGKIAGVTFDLWDTLVREEPGGSKKVASLRIRRIADALDSMGHPRRLHEIEEAHRKTGEFLEQIWSENRDLDVSDHVEFMLGCLEQGLPDAIGSQALDEIQRIYANSMLEHPPVLIPHAKDALEEIGRMGCRVGLISNTGKTPGSTLRVLLDRMDILRLFDVATFSDEVKARKPSPLIFKVTLEKLKVFPEESVHVGDDRHKDIQGAKRCGMAAIHVPRLGESPYPGADRTLESVIDVPKAVRELEQP